MADITGDGGNNLLVGTSGNDNIWGLGGDDILIGGDGNDRLDGGTGADTMDGGSGNDTYIVDNINDKVVEYANNGIDTIRASITYSLNWAQNVENLVLTGSADINGFGNALDNSITGNSGDNALWGLDGNDILKGGGGDDYLNGGSGDDLMTGGIGDDYYVVDSPYDRVIEHANEGIDTIASSISFFLDLDAPNVEKLILTGSGNILGRGNALDNEITGNSGNNVFDGGAGDDIMRGGAGDDVYYVDSAGDQVIEYANQGWDGVYSSISYTLGANLEWLGLLGSGNLSGYGNTLNNVLYGNSGANTLYGYGGDDQLDGKAGADTMYGGQGDDYYFVDDPGDLVIELANEGTDTVYVQGDLSYTLTANVERLWLDFNGHGNATGNALNNWIYGSQHDNVIDGGAGQDLMQGFGGNDIYYVDNVLDWVAEFANDGYDTVFSTVDFDLGLRGQHVEVLSLAIGNAVYGTGNDQNNTIFGNAGDNVLNGGAGADSLSGLGGNDTFVFYKGQAHGDVVYEFDGNGAGQGDVLKFVGYGPGATLNQMSATEWMIISGDGLTQEVITLVGAPSLDASDYVFV